MELNSSLSPMRPFALFSPALYRKERYSFHMVKAEHLFDKNNVLKRAIQIRI